MRLVRIAVWTIIALVFMDTWRPALAQTLESGVAITDSEALAELDQTGWSLGALLAPSWTRGARVAPLNNKRLAELPSLVPLHKTIADEFKQYENDYEDRFKTDAVVGFNKKFNHRLFDHSFLQRESGRFELVGIVNRMDRAWKDTATCGEVRLIYRLAYREQQANGLLASRLPMGFNLVFRAKNPDQPVTCAEIAKRWLAAGNFSLKGIALARKLSEPKGLLDLIAPDQIDRFETNIQVIRVPVKESDLMERLGGNAEYLLNVFKRTSSGTYERDRLENQPDRKALMSDPAKLAALKRWLFTREAIEKLAEGTIQIPDQFLAYQAISSAPGGTARPSNRPFADLVTDADVAEAFQRLGIRPGQLRNIDTVLGFQQRLNEVTCSGCHQSRAIGGFHFMGADREETIRTIPQNAIFVPASPHFYAETPRRRAVVKAFAEGKQPSWLRGFALRPRTDQAGAALHGTQIRNGWGAACYSGNDQSFKSWTCSGAALTCRSVHGSPHEPGFGMCVTNTDNYRELKVGDPFQFGTYHSTRIKHYYRDDFNEHHDMSEGRGGSRQGGGFFGGMHKIRGHKDRCSSLPPEAVCAQEAATDFNPCVAKSGGNFKKCLEENTTWAGLRTCDLKRPCRDDYVCLATRDTPAQRVGACLPPYFLFQFRVDGHPLEKK